MPRTTMTALFEKREISTTHILGELERLGESTTEQDCHIRHYLQEILRLRQELADERDILNTLEEFGLQTTGSIYGVHSVSSPPGFQRRWICWQGQKHTNLRDAMRQAIQIRKGTHAKKGNQ